MGPDRWPALVVFEVEISLDWVGKYRSSPTHQDIPTYLQIWYHAYPDEVSWFATDTNV